MSTIDLLIEQAIVVGELAAGGDFELIRTRSPGMPVASLTGGKRPKTAKALSWSDSEDEFLRQNLGLLSEDEMASKLGRSATAVHLRWKRDLRLPAPSKDPRYITATKAAQMLDIDAHKVVGWVDQGRMPGERMAGKRRIRRIPRLAFRRWLVKPDHWMLFDVERIKDDQLCRLVRLARTRWGDEWWSLRQAADYHEADTKDVLRYVYRQEIPAVRVENIAGRSSNPGWAHWFVRRSDAIKLVIHRGSGGSRRAWSEGGDAFMLLAFAVGLPTGAIAWLMGGDWPAKRVSYRLDALRKRDQIPELTAKYELAIATRGKVMFCDWRLHWRRFPRLAQAMSALDNDLNNEGRPELKPDDIPLVRGVLSTWAKWHGVKGSLRGRMSAERVIAVSRRLLAHGVSPFLKEMTTQQITQWIQIHTGGYS